MTTLEPINRSDLESLAAAMSIACDELIATGERLRMSILSIGPTLDELMNRFSIDRRDKLPRKTRKALFKQAMGRSLTAGERRRVHRAETREYHGNVE